MSRPGSALPARMRCTATRRHPHRVPHQGRKRQPPRRGPCPRPGLRARPNGLVRHNRPPWSRDKSRPRLRLRLRRHRSPERRPRRNQLRRQLRRWRQRRQRDKSRHRSRRVPWNRPPRPESGLRRRQRLPLCLRRKYRLPLPKHDPWSRVLTDLPPPPEDPQERQRWASRLLRDWSRPEYQNLLGAQEIRALARQVLQANLPPSSPPREPRQKRVPRPLRRVKRPRLVPGQANQPPP